MTEIDIEHLKSWTGKQEVLEDPIAPFSARAFAAALDHEVLPAAGDCLPLFWQWIHFLPTPRASGTGADGHPLKGGFLPPVPLPRRMWASSDMSLHAPLVIGTPATRTSTIESVDLKAGKSGSLIFVNVGHEFSQNGALCISDRQTIVYRDMPEGPAPLPPGGAPERAAEFSRTVVPDPVLLFRFSALMYNGHRIHYDRDYAVNEEFYPALVVQGPLLASMLLDLLSSEVPDFTVARFRFRATRPTFDDQPFQLQGCRDGDTVHLWTLDHEGFVGVSATASAPQK